MSMRHDARSIASRGLCRNGVAAPSPRPSPPPRGRGSPVLRKFAEGQASRVRPTALRADSPAQFEAAFRRVAHVLEDAGLSGTDAEILVEEYLPGAEVAVEGLLTQGRDLGHRVLTRA